MRGIGAFKYKSGEFAAFSLYFLGQNNTTQRVYASLTCKIDLVKSFKVNLLIGNNIIFPEGFIIEIQRRSLFIWSSGVTVSIDAR